ncbi:HAD hydrolase-like protein [Acidihalobacter aeolianus]|uniref:HAD hydrolase-like protein n=1 Tax=Acidihalobacter aeolianus TaxID=2792603 RepID=UPI000AE50568|nr:HAD hydrolase-like protein [Acidihalobacter aeolianus]
MIATPRTGIRNVLLDLDGTLVDPRQGFVNSVEYALVRLGVEPPPADRIASHIGPPLGETLALLLGDTHGDRVQDAIGLYRERYVDTGIFETELYPGIPEALHAIAESGARICLATSKPTVYARQILEHCGLASLFHGIYGSELDGTRADKRKLLAHLLEQEDMDPMDAIMVGDRAQDIRAARVNGMASLGVLWGYGSEEELWGAEADGVVAVTTELAISVMRGE